MNDAHPTEQPIKPIAYSRANAARAIGVCEKTLCRAIDAGEITISKLGTRVVIPAWSLEAFIRSKEIRKTKATA